MLEFLKSEDIEMVTLGTVMMKSLLPKSQWKDTLLISFTWMTEDGKYGGQRWDWQITEEDEAIKVDQPMIYNHSWGSTTTWTTIGTNAIHVGGGITVGPLNSYTVTGGAACGTSTGGTITFTSPSTPTTYISSSNNVLTIGP